MQDIFWHLKETIDAYFPDRAFSVTVMAGCLHGLKPCDVEGSGRGAKSRLCCGR